MAKNRNRETGAQAIITERRHGESNGALTAKRAISRGAYNALRNAPVPHPALSQP